MVHKPNETEGTNLSLRRRVRRYWIEDRAVNDPSGKPPADRPADERFNFLYSRPPDGWRHTSHTGRLRPDATPVLLNLA